MTEPHRDTPAVSERAAAIEAALRAALPGQSIEVVDESAGHLGHGGYDPRGSHFRVRISDNFPQARATLHKHRLVYDALRPLMSSGEIHALAIELCPPPAEPD